VVLRPVVDERLRTPSLSVIVPAQNDHGNVAAALGRLPALTSELEVLFVEGHSTDGTWDEIDRVAGGPTLSRPAAPGRPEPLAPRPPGDPIVGGHRGGPARGAARRTCSVLSKLARHDSKFRPAASPVPVTKRRSDGG
jgi:hypothetical protein